MLQAVRGQGLRGILAEDEETRELVARVAFMSSLQDGWPDLSEGALMERLEEVGRKRIRKCRRMFACARRTFMLHKCLCRTHMSAAQASPPLSHSLPSSLSLSYPAHFHPPLTSTQTDKHTHARAHTHTHTHTHTQWLAPALQAEGSIKAVTKRGVATFISSTLLTYDQQRLLTTAAPTTLLTPAGNEAALQYALDHAGQDRTEGGGLAAPPVLESKLQEWFGCTSSPRVGPNGDVAVLLRLLSPAGRPIADTQDLPFFWQNGYVAIRSELRARYSKHPWPEDPLTAAPTRQTNKAIRAAGGDRTTAGSAAGRGTSEGGKGRASRRKKKK